MYPFGSTTAVRRNERLTSCTLCRVCRSDADAEVLAEYIIALLKHDGNKESVRELCEQEIPDFLTEGMICVFFEVTGGNLAR